MAKLHPQSTSSPRQKPPTGSRPAGLLQGYLTNPAAGGRAGFTIVEMLIVITIIGILMSLLLPALNAMVEVGRRTTCQNNLLQLMMAVQNYEHAHEVYPPGTINDKGPIQHKPMGYHHSWIVQLLPHLQQRVVYRHIDRSVSVYHDNNAGAASYFMEMLLCPSDPPGNTGNGYSAFAAVHHDVKAPIDVDNHGVFFLNSRVRYDDVSDGHGHTLFLGEKIGRCDLPDLGWMSGTASTLRNTGTPINQTGEYGSGAWLQWPDPDGYRSREHFWPGEDFADDPGSEADAEPDGQADDPTLVEEDEPEIAWTEVGGFESFHGAGANFALGDGRLVFLSQDIDMTIYRNMGHRADGEMLDMLEE